MQASLLIYLPIATSLISLITALSVAFIGFRFSRSMETQKIRASYLNYSLQKLMDEYVNYDPVIDLSRTESNNFVPMLEERFNDCRASVRRVAPLMRSPALEKLRNMELHYSKIIRCQYNARLSEIARDAIPADEYAQLLTNYINSGHELLQKEVEHVRLRLEKGFRS